MNYPRSIQKLIESFSKFPTIGPRTAARFVFYLLKAKDEDVDRLVSSISDLKKNIKTCSLCFNTFEAEAEICEICSNSGRDKKLLCIVSKDPDLMALEKLKIYKGLYFILGGTVSALRKKDIEKLRFKELKERLKKDPGIQEIIIATNPNTEGEATALYIERILAPLNKKITRLGRGLPVGGELEYADEETLKSALEGRK
ncbi:MAG: recombination mediator RecR [Patescibacteria group bacterium]|nr:recombination mediator RecR [Patescibacteria group bacterium]